MALSSQSLGGWQIRMKMWLGWIGVGRLWGANSCMIIVCYAASRMKTRGIAEKILQKQQII